MLKIMEMEIIHSISYIKIKFSTENVEDFLYAQKGGVKYYEKNNRE